MNTKEADAFLDQYFEEHDVPKSQRQRVKTMVLNAYNDDTAGLRGEVKSVVGLRSEVNLMLDRLDRLETREQKLGLDSSRRVVEGKGPLLSLEQKAAPHFKVDKPNFDPERVRIGAIVAGLAMPEIQELWNNEEKALGTLTGPSGDFLVPEAIGSIWIDAVRPHTQVIRAGARTYPMEAQFVRLPGWDTATIPTAAWAPEGIALADQGGTFRMVELAAKAVGCVATLDVEILDNAGPNLAAIDEIVTNEILKAIAQAIDYAALLGSGAASVPQGLASLDSTSVLTTISGVTQQSPGGANGLSPTWDDIVKGVGAVRSANFDPSGILYASRVAQSLSLVKDTTGQYVIPPTYLDGVTRYETNQIPITMKKGTNTDASATFIGDWSQCVIGFRPKIGVRVIRDPYTQAAARQLRLVIYQYSDVAFLNKNAFVVIDGQRP